MQSLSGGSLWPHLPALPAILLASCLGDSTWLTLIGPWQVCRQVLEGFPEAVPVGVCVCVWTHVCVDCVFLAQAHVYAWATLTFPALNFPRNSPLTHPYLQ